MGKEEREEEDMVREGPTQVHFGQTNPVYKTDWSPQVGEPEDSSSIDGVYETSTEENGGGDGQIERDTEAGSIPEV